MATPAKYLPPPFSQETIQSLLSQCNLLLAEEIELFPSNAAYHSHYILRFPPEYNFGLVGDEDGTGSTTLVLRVQASTSPA